MNRQQIWFLCAAAIGATACDGAHPEVALEPPSVLRLTAPGVRERPTVRFDHALHEKALEKEGCEACHPVKDDTTTFSFLTPTLPQGPTARMEHFHEGCNVCHEKKKAPKVETPMACAECHVEGPTTSARVDLRFDYSLHARHTKAADDKCEACHHVYDEAQKKLVYQKGKESACSDCHGAQADGETPSLRDAAHAACVNCHQNHEPPTGPTACVGCHDAEKIQGIKELAEVPRLVRGQPDAAWIDSKDGKSPAVPFNHAAHEPTGRSCSTCHHQTLQACGTCHTLQGKEEGHQVTLAMAFHDATSKHSCAGCHAETATAKECAGCHHAIGELPRERTCETCHTGKPAVAAAEAGAPVEEPPTVMAPVALAPLPEVGDGFPEKLVIDRMKDKYGPSTLPHQKIVEKLNQSVANSKLATRFHGRTETLCAGCHHHSPVGQRPPPCASCHTEEGAPTHDQPSLKAAYHRQCLGCHEQMGLKQTGCTDCHAEVTK